MAAMDKGRAQVLFQRMLDFERWAEAELHDFGAIVVIMLIAVSSAFYVWMLIKPLVKSEKKD